MVENWDDSLVKKKAAMWAGSTADSSVLRTAALRAGKMAVGLALKLADCSVALMVAG